MRKMKEVGKDGSGAALVVAIVIIFVLVALASSVLVVAYTLFGMTTKQSLSMQCHELAVSVSEMLREQIDAEDLSIRIKDAEDFRAKMESKWIQENYPLWFFLRTQILQGDKVWRYYDESGGDYAHTAQLAFRELSLDLSGAGYAGELDDYDLKVLMYWISTREEAEGDKTNPAQRYLNAAPTLVVTVECSCGDMRSVVTSKYILSVGDFDGLDTVPADGKYTLLVDGDKLIYWKENWKFTPISMR